uniref:Uncharacterized protein n=1 Tax=Arundo donax TaxID=35708 RepID=A0A0A9HR53_ARUDO
MPFNELLKQLADRRACSWVASMLLQEGVIVQVMQRNI